MERRMICMLMACLTALAIAAGGCGKDGDGPTDPSPTPEKPVPASISFLDEGPNLVYYRNGNSITIKERDSMYFRCFSYDASGNITRDTVFNVLTSSNAPCAIYSRRDYYNWPYKVMITGSLPSSALLANTAILSEVHTPNKQPVSHTLNITVTKRYITSDTEVWGFSSFPYTYESTMYFFQIGDSLICVDRNPTGKGRVQQGLLRFDCSFPHQPPRSDDIKYFVVRFTNMNQANGMAYRFNGDSIQVKLTRR